MWTHAKTHCQIYIVVKNKDILEALYLHHVKVTKEKHGKYDSKIRYRIKEIFMNEFLFTISFFGDTIHLL